MRDWVITHPGPVKSSYQKKPGASYAGRKPYRGQGQARRPEGRFEPRNGSREDRRGPRDGARSGGYRGGSAAEGRGTWGRAQRAG